MIKKLLFFVGMLLAGVFVGFLMVSVFGFSGGTALAEDLDRFDDSCGCGGQQRHPEVSRWTGPRMPIVMQT